MRSLDGIKETFFVGALIAYRWRIQGQVARANRRVNLIVGFLSLLEDYFGALRRFDAADS